jgi:hypothetical protein
VVSGRIIPLVPEPFLGTRGPPPRHAYRAAWRLAAWPRAVIRFVPLFLSRFRYGRWGCNVGIRFPVVKLLDYATDLAGLEANPNPFAALVPAHLKTRETRQDPDARCAWKVRLIKSLYERGLSKDEVRKLFRLIDWMMDLPEAQYQRFRQEMEQSEREKQVPYITSVELHGIEKGKREGLLEGINSCLKVQFGAAGLELIPAVESVTDVNRLQAILKAIETATDLEELRKLFP